MTRGVLAALAAAAGRPDIASLARTAAEMTSTLISDSEAETGLALRPGRVRQTVHRIHLDGRTLYLAAREHMGWSDGDADVAIEVLITDQAPSDETYRDADRATVGRGPGPRWGVREL